MGQLIDGVWHRGALTGASEDGAFRRKAASFRNWITPDGRAGPSGKPGFKAETGRYHLYVSHACPWANRTMIFRELKDLTGHINISVVHPDMLEDGWTFETGFPGTTGDRLFGASHAHQIYSRADPQVTTRVTVPILWDSLTGEIVSNESAEIIRMFNSAFDAITGNRADFYPEPLRPRIDEINDRVYDTLNNGVYKSGFAQSQAAYDSAVAELFDTMDWLEAVLTANRYLAGDRLTEADWRLFTTLVRFDLVYATHFKCNRRRVVDYPALWAYARELYQMPGIAGTVHFDHIARHYYYSHDSINPHRIVPIGPKPDWHAPHGREALTAA